MQKAQSFNQNKPRKNLIEGVNLKLRPHKHELSDGLKNTRQSSVNRIESAPKIMPRPIKQKVRIKRKCCNGKGGCSGSRPATKIHIVKTDYKHLNDHPVNQTIKSINNFISHAFKVKSKDDYDIPTIISLGKQLGIIYPKTQIVDHNFLRSREFLSFSKEKILRYLYSAINKSNGNIEPDNSKALAPFRQNRFFIGKGNNSVLVRSVLKQRWWWSPSDSEDLFNVNFLWTQWRKNKHLSILDTHHPCVNKNMLELK